MRRVILGSGRAATASLLIVVLLAPVALASDTTSDASLWAEFLAWFQSRFNIPGGATAADNGNFTVWLMSRWTIPGG